MLALARRYVAFLQPSIFGIDDAALVAGGGALIGGALGALTGRTTAKENVEYQREFASHGIRWRVQDAQAAGVHPLFALGANTQGFAPNPVVPYDYGIAQAGQNMGQAMRAGQTVDERALQQAQLENLASATSKNQSESLYYLSMAAAARQQPSTAIDDPFVQANRFVIEEGKPVFPSNPRRVYEPEQGLAQAGPLIQRLPDRPPIGQERIDPRFDQSVQEGTNPAWTRWNMDRGFEIVLPNAGSQGGSLAESMEGIPSVAWPIIYEKNVQLYGPGWADRFAKMYPGYYAASQAASGNYTPKGKLKPGRVAPGTEQYAP
ncbi:MAG: DNA pilot protein [Microvirus sp.]|nr:MAG: DNA pilot protein [Microvirus sp.]